MDILWGNQAEIQKIQIAVPLFSIWHMTAIFFYISFLFLSFHLFILSLQLVICLQLLVGIPGNMSFSMLRKLTYPQKLRGDRDGKFRLKSVYNFSLILTSLPGFEPALLLQIHSSFIGTKLTHANKHSRLVIKYRDRNFRTRGRRSGSVMEGMFCGLH